MNQNPYKFAIVERLCVDIFGTLAPIPDDIKSRIELVSQCRLEDINNLEDVDVEWSRDLFHKVNKWMLKLVDHHSSHISRIEIYWEMLSQLPEFAASNLPERSIGIELCRVVVARINDLLEAKIPNSLYVSNYPLNLYIDETQKLAYFDLETDKQAISIEPLVELAISGSQIDCHDLTIRLSQLLIAGLCKGEVPLPSFRFSDSTDGICQWRWVSPEDEAKQKSQLDKCLSNEELRVWDTHPRFALLMETPIVNLESFEVGSVVKSIKELLLQLTGSGIAFDDARDLLTMKMAESLQVAATTGDRKLIENRVKVLQILTSSDISVKTIAEKA